MDDKKRIPATTYCRHTGRSGKKEGVYEVGSKIGLQQCQDQGRRRMESSIHHTHWSVRTHRNIFRVDKLPRYFPNDDERPILGPYKPGGYGNLH